MRLSAPLSLLLAGCLIVQASAGEWPQILGPDRNGVAEGEQVRAGWPAGGPRVEWQRQVGAGLAGLAVVEGRAVLFHRVGDEEVAEGLDPATGETLWSAKFPTRYQSTYTSDHGPRCVPLIHNGNVYLYGAGRGLHSVALADGKVRWSRDLFREYTAPQEEGYFGAGSSPIVADDKLLVNLGAARQGAGLLAVLLDSGKTTWQATDELASYSSPVTATIGGVRQVVFVTRFNVLGVNAETGEVYWSFPFGARGPTVNAASPLVLDGHVFVSASYGIGAVFARVTGQQPHIVWKSDVMASQYTTCVEQDGYLYGIDGRQDLGVARLRCLDAKTGKVAWTEEGFGKGSLILADGKLLIQKTNGQLVLAEATPKAYRELAAAAVLSDEAYALPALANGLLYVRDGTTLKCLDVRP